MALPVNDQYQTPVDQVLDTRKPAWWLAQAVSTWAALGSNTIFDVQPNYSLVPGYRSAIIDAWGGGALVYKDGAPHLAIFGGGHNDYWGNEIPGLNLLADAPAWALLVPGSAQGDCIYNDPDGIYPDGRPASSHIYGAIEFARDAGVLMLLGQPFTYGAPPLSTYNVWDCNIATGVWTQRASDLPVTPGGQFPGGFSARHPSSGAGGVEEIWYHAIAQGGLLAYRPDNDTWRGPYGDWYGEYQMTAALDPARNKLLAIGSAGLKQWDLTALTGPLTPSTTGSGLATPNAPGLVYVPPPFDRFIAWNNSGQTLYVLNHTAGIPYAWSTLIVGGATPSAPNGGGYGGTFGKCRYVPGLHGLVLVNKTTASAYFFKLPATP